MLWNQKPARLRLEEVVGRFSQAGGAEGLADQLIGNIEAFVRGEPRNVV
ncbi:MAG TPA: hypothetical protein VJ751_04790 [Pyrinomonadaceae bacterium]|nr:hypothetical protein [Pyrinomonadaceae bacterium]